MNTSTPSRSQLKAFPPAPSWGWLWPLGLAGVLAYNAVERVAMDMLLLSVALVALLASLSVWTVAIACPATHPTTAHSLARHPVARTVDAARVW